MFTKKQIHPLSMGIRIFTLLALLVPMFFATTVLAEGDGPVISIERLRGIKVGIKIVFPNNISGDLSVFLNQKRMDCTQVAADTLYCIGSLRPKEAVLLTVFDSSNEAITFTTTIIGPESNEPEPDPDPCIAMVAIPEGGFKLASPSQSALWNAFFSWGIGCKHL